MNSNQSDEKYPKNISIMPAALNRGIRLIEMDGGLNFLRLITKTYYYYSVPELLVRHLRGILPMRMRQFTILISLSV